MNERIPARPPEIKRVPDHVKRPRWSVMIPVYNCSHFLVENLESVLKQDPGPEFMQIEVIDDYSTDADVAALVLEIGQGRVGYHRQPRNVGSLRNFETCINRSVGEYVHLLHGDDKIKPGFYQEIESLFSAFPEAAAAFTGYTYIDELNNRISDNDRLLEEPGLLEDWLLKLARSQQIQPPAMVVKRSVYEKLGGFYAVHYGEDWEMWTRIAAHYPVAHSPKVLALYRVHENNITSRYFLSGQSMTDIMKVVDIIQTYLPPVERKNIKRFAKKHLAIYFSITSDKIYHVFGKPQVALQQARRAMGMHLNSITFFYWMKIYLKYLFRYKMDSEKNGYVSFP